MKKIVSMLIFASLVTNADNIDNIVNKIKSKRVGTIDKKELISVNSPIPTVVIVDSNSSNNKDNNSSKIIINSENFVLKAIMNDMAFINNKWVKIGQKVGSYTLVDIMDDSVYLKDKSKTKMIFFKKENKIKITGR